ncbi:thiamine-phosphate kinase [Roseibium polysiphoniae]|uniref:thiamine-phosphate kinase n=1 Tax=Roseibium polysiphoniae TaxID=2571221 RepID=UPI00329A27AF
MAGDRPQEAGPEQAGADQRLGEFELIKRYLAPLASDPGSLGLTDDAAVYAPHDSHELVLTKDMLAANVHFFADDPPEAIAAKALRVNLSDLAAKGAVPTAYLLGLGLPDDWREDWLERFCCGLSGDQSAFNVVLLGGDTIRTGDGLQISVTAIGETPVGTAVRRSGAAPGDLLYVTGTIGDAAAGLKARLDPGFAHRMRLSESDHRHILDRYLLPQPKVKLAGAVRASASAAMDISDGLLADAGHLARASGVDLLLELADVPLSSALMAISKADQPTFQACLNGGDDYEILACVPEDRASAFEADATAAGCPVTRIGKVKSGSGQLQLQGADGPLPIGQFPGFRHF